jgi:uncharacterized repeat protein (TIGR03803 family)
MKNILFLLTAVYLFNFANGQSHALFGVTEKGGSDGIGVIFKCNPDGSGYEDIYNFRYTHKESEPLYTRLIQASDGKLYGVTYAGGLNNLGCLFSYDISTGMDSTLLSFNGANGAYPSGSLMQASNGLIYGMTSVGGTNNKGVIFNFDIVTGKDSVLLNFNGVTDGYNPYGGLVQASNGKLYGTTYYGGLNNEGTYFMFNPGTHKDSMIINGCAGGCSFGNPTGSLIVGNTGYLYGMTTNSTVVGGTGSIEYINPTTNYANDLYGFLASGPGTPYGDLIEAKNNVFYGFTYTGASPYSQGLLFSYKAPSAAITPLVTFTGLNGSYPTGSLVQASNGLLYGMTSRGGVNGYGVLFSLDTTTNTITKRLDFNWQNGAYPEGSLMQASDGKLYGMTSAGGAGTYGTGVLFYFDPSTNKDSVLFSFYTAPYGVNPVNGLIQANNGLLYGTTISGGTQGSYGGQDGVLFSIDPNTYQYNVEADFNDAVGAYPFGGLIQASNGLLYGMTNQGGKYTDGTLYSFDIITKKDTALWNGSSTPGQRPYGKLFQDTNGLLYGMCIYGGFYSDGTLLNFNTVSNVGTPLIDFNGTDGSDPYAGLIKASDGKLYGTTTAGGVSNFGCIINYDISANKENMLISFSGPDGEYPYGDLIQDTNGLIYGMTTSGGLYNKGVLFSYSILRNTDSVVVNFDSIHNGQYPYGGLVQDSIGRLYGMTSSGGSNNYGVLFRYDPHTGKDTTLVNLRISNRHNIFSFNGSKGANPKGTLSYVKINDLILSANNTSGMNLEHIEVYPNPFSSITTVQFSANGIHYIEVDDITGRELKWIECNGAQYRLNRNELADGIYLLKAFDAEQHNIGYTKVIIE